MAKPTPRKPRIKHVSKTVKKPAKQGRPKKESVKSLRLSFRITEELADALKSEAQDEGRTLSGHVAWLLERHIKQKQAKDT